MWAEIHITISPRHGFKIWVSQRIPWHPARVSVPSSAPEPRRFLKWVASRREFSPFIRWAPTGQWVTKYKKKIQGQERARYAISITSLSEFPTQRHVSAHLYSPGRPWGNEKVQAVNVSELLDYRVGRKICLQPWMQWSRASGRSWNVLLEVLICNQWAQAIARRKGFVYCGLGFAGESRLPF